MEDHLWSTAPADIDRSAVGLLQPGDDSQECGLSTPALADERHSLTLADFEVDAAERLQMVVAPEATSDRETTS